MTPAPDTVLVLAPNWLGDAVMALPAIRDLRAHFAGSRFAVAARGSVAMLFRAVPGVDEIVVLEPDTPAARLRADIGVLLPNSFRAAWLLARAGVPERWGYAADFRTPLLTRSIRRPRVKLHFGEYYQNLVRELGVATGPLTPELRLPGTRIETAGRLLRDAGWDARRPLVGVAPGAAFGHAKRWPRDRFAALASRLRAALGAECVVLGRSEDRDAAAGIEGLDLVGRTDLLMLMGVLGHCRAVVANDSGTLHLAAALGVPVTAIYGPTDERYSLPLSSRGPSGAVSAVVAQVFCRPCGLRDCPIDHRCMRRISTERVFQAVRAQLGDATEVSA